MSYFIERSRISAKTDAQKKVDDAAKVLGAFLKMITDVVNQAKQGGFYRNQSSKALLGDQDLKYEFRIEEGEQQFDTIIEGKALQIDAWVVKIVSRNGTPPSGLLPGQRPFVDIPVEGIIRNEIPDKDIKVGTDWSKGIYAYWYSLDGGPLTGDKAQVIEGRTVTMPGMNILERQDAKSTVFLKRNEELVEGHPSANEFIYQTPNVSFTNPLLPTIDQSEPFNIAIDKGGVTKPLAVFLSDFFKALFKKSVGETQTIQMECQYAYSLVENLDPIHLPVLMLPPISINPKTDFIMPEGGCPAVIQRGENSPFVCELSNRILYWFSQNKPSKNKGKFTLDLTVMSDLTQQPMPLIRLRRLYLNIGDISDISDI